MSDEVEELVRTFPKSVQPGVPKLKAPQPGWRTVKFGDVLFPVVRPVRLDDGQSYRLVTVKRSRGGIEERGRMSGRQIAVKSQFEIEGGDFLISKRQIVHGACGVVTDDFAGAIVSNEYSILRCSPELDLNFLRYLSHTVYFQQTCFHSSIGVHVEKMIFKLDEWLDWPVNLPTLREQEKIAGFLGVVDGKISGLRQKEEGLKRFKAGLMQKLFSQELRFTRDDGSDFPDWEEKRLGEITRWSSGGTPSKDNPDFWDGDIPWVSALAMHFPLISDAPLKVTKSAIGKGTRMAPRGAILMLVRGSMLYNRIPICVTTREVAFNQDVKAIVGTGGVTHEFLASWLRANESLLMSMVTGTGIGAGKLETSELQDMPIQVPHPEEQRKIAAALSALDGKIAGVRDQIAGLETFKKGLLQQMFV
ncbi:restriction endonuclease subunit S [Stagnihabitans tardus]|jgi:type I restriction enzyme S subunit|uniref:Restriction endonuclease subunit S n=1 Tax=Stagnihabitans tardus TaxID=2699202 RepID=A0AAE5BTE4_9RHOB|nr:restriction endonuclease subunit S [Stagnihabitans tardus]NBZ88910.1 restriction endonuclease subunit S [Stagnihabitans tardus]